MAEPPFYTRIILRLAFQKFGESSILARHGNSTSLELDQSRIYLPSGHWFIKPDATSVYIYYTLAPFITCVTCIHLINAVSRYLRRRAKRRGIRNEARNTTRTKQGSCTPIPTSDSVGRGDDSMSKTSSVKGIKTPIWSRLCKAPRTALRNAFVLRAIPASIFSVSNYAELTWTIVYCVVVIVPILVVSAHYVHQGKNVWSNPVGSAAFAQLPIIIALSSRNNLISFLTGVSYQELNYLHRASGRLCLLCSWLHTIGWLDGAYNIGTTGRFRLNQAWMIWGFVALAALTILTLTSFRIVRQLVYEFFLFTHIIFTLLFLIGAWFHWDWAGYWVASGLFLWILDRIISFVRMTVINKLWVSSSCDHTVSGQGKIEIMDGEVMRMTVDRPSFTWKAGQHAYISCPSIGWMKLEQHPMSIANMPSGVKNNSRNEVVFLIKAEQGFTRRLYNELKGNTTTSIPTYIDGPYGTSEDLSHHNSILLVAGGTGITHILSHAIHILSLPDHSRITSRIIIIWNIRHTSHAEWIFPLLNKHLTEIPEDLALSIRIHVTRSHVSDEPGEERVRFRGRLGSMVEGVPLLNDLRDEDGDRGSYTPLEEEEEEEEEGEEESGGGRLSGKSSGSGSGSCPSSVPTSQLNTILGGDDRQELEDDQELASESQTFLRAAENDLASSLRSTSSFRDKTPKTELADRSSRGNCLSLSHLRLMKADAIQWKKGRANLISILSEEMDNLKNDPNRVDEDKSIGVLVCGPKALIDDAAKAVREVNTARKVWFDGICVEFYRDTFGW